MSGYNVKILLKKNFSRKHSLSHSEVLERAGPWLPQTWVSVLTQPLKLSCWMSPASWAFCKVRPRVMMSTTQSPRRLRWFTLRYSVCCSLGIHEKNTVLLVHVSQTRRVSIWTSHIFIHLRLKNMTVECNIFGISFLYFAILIYLLPHS